MAILAQTAPTTLEEALKHIQHWKKLALIDELTGLYHRRAGDRYLSQLIAKKQQFLLFSIDLNKFKPINDRAGHEAGDKVLRAIAQSLRKDGSGIAYRWGGDEFLVVAKGNKADGEAIKHRLKWSILSVNLDGYLAEDMAGHRCGAAIGWVDSS